MAYISTEEVKAIRAALKAKFGKDVKFSVVRRDSHAVAVSIMSSKHDFSDMWDGKDEEDYGYGYVSINPYYITKENYGDHVKFFQQIVDIIKTAPADVPGGEAWFDKSDSMIDYFNVAFYFDVNVGRYDRPYVQKG